jgi:hypothetical protein
MADRQLIRIQKLRNGQVSPECRGTARTSIPTPDRDTDIRRGSAMRTKTRWLVLVARFSTLVYLPLFSLEPVTVCTPIEKKTNKPCPSYSFISSRPRATALSDSSSPIVIFDLNIPFSISQGQTAQSYNVNSSFYLDEIETIPRAVRISVSNPSCPPFTRCSIPTRTVSVEITLGKIVTLFNSLVISLDSLTTDAATFTVAQFR